MKVTDDVGSRIHTQLQLHLSNTITVLVVHESPNRATDLFVTSCHHGDTDVNDDYKLCFLCVSVNIQRPRNFEMYDP